MLQPKEQKLIHRYAGIFKTIAHPIRLAILKTLTDSGSGRMTVKNIYEKLQIDQPIASHHLGVLKKAGLVRREQESGNTYYYICKNDDQVESVVNLLNETQC